MDVTPEAVAREVEEVYFPAFVDALREEDPQLKRLLLHAHSRGQNLTWDPGVMALYERTMVYLAVKQYLARERAFELGWEHRYSEGKQQWLDVALLVNGTVAAAIEVKTWYRTSDLRRDIKKLQTLDDTVAKYLLTYWHQPDAGDSTEDLKREFRVVKTDRFSSTARADGEDRPTTVHLALIRV